MLVFFRLKRRETNRSNVSVAQFFLCILINVKSVFCLLDFFEKFIFYGFYFIFIYIFFSTKCQRKSWPYKMCKNRQSLYHPWGSNQESSIHCPMPKLKKNHGLGISMLSFIHICTALTLLEVVSRYLPYLFSIDIYRASTV